MTAHDASSGGNRLRVSWRRVAASLLLAGPLLLGETAAAADRAIGADRLRVRDQRSLRHGVANVRRTFDLGSADGAIVAPEVGGALDPSLVGAALFVLDAGGGEAARVELPAAGWTRSGESWRFRAKSKTDAGRSKTSVDLGPGRLRAKVRGKGTLAFSYSLDEATQGGLAVVLEIAGGAERYCSEFTGGGGGGDTGSSDAGCNVSGSFTGKGAPAPASCADTPGATVRRDVCDAATLFDLLVEGQIETHAIPGLGAALIRGGQVVWARGYGLRHSSPDRPVLPDTPFLLASISKTVTATAVLQLVEDGVFGLDDDIDAILDFDVDNPLVPGDETITVRHLLTHTSGLADDESVWGGFPGEAASLYVLGDSPIALRDFLVGYFTPGGQWYDAHRNFTASTPGTQYLYSNLATALLGYLVEAATGTSLDDHCDSHLFAPLGMLDTGWHLSDFAAVDLAMPYESFGGGLQEWGHYGYPDYPNGQLRASAADLARFLAAWAGGGIIDGVRILEEATVAEALTVQSPGVDPAQGLSWYYATIGSRSVVGHNGGDYGATTDMFFDPATGNGVVVLVNTDETPARVRAMARIEEALFAISESP
ncbi:MAG: serine hydrolase domain-containing protein [Candidatus Binatia bacterium]